MKIAVVFVSAILVAPIVPFATAQNVLLNGSFESPAIPLNSILPAVPTSWNGSAVIMINGDYSPGYPLPYEGQQYLSLGNSSSSLSQAFSVSSPGMYALSWSDSSEFNSPTFTSPYTVTVVDSLMNVIVSADFDANAAGLRVWTARSIPLALGSDTFTLRFQSHVPMFGQTPLIDDVRLIPEPSTFTYCFIVTLLFVSVLTCTRSSVWQAG